MTEGFYVHIAVDVWLGKGKPAPTLLASYFTLKLLTEYEESLLALTNNVSGYCQLPVKTYHFAEVQDIDLRSANKLKQKLDETVEKLDVNAACFVPEDWKTTERQHWVCISSSAQ